MAFLAPAMEALGIGGEAGGLGAMLSGGGARKTLMMGNLMNHAMSGGGDGMAQMGPSPGASVAEPAGTTGKVGADMFGEDEVGMATQNRGENSDPESASSTGIEGEAEHGDSPEQLKDVGGAATGPFAQDNLEQEHGADPDVMSTATNAFHSNLPLVLEYAFSDQSGADHPVLKALDALIEQAFPGYKDTQPPEGAMGNGETPNDKLEGELGQDLDDDKKVNGEPEKTAGVNYDHDPNNPRCQQCFFGDGGELSPTPMKGGNIAHLCSKCRGGSPLPSGSPMATHPSGHQFGGDIGGSDSNYSQPYMPRNAAERIAMSAGYCPACWGPLDVLGRCASVHQADVPAAVSQGQGTDPSMMMNMTGIPTCPQCGQSHIAGTPCPTSQMQAPIPAAQASPTGAGFDMAMQPNPTNKVVTKYKLVTAAEYDDSEVVREPRHNESYEDGETPDTGWYEDWKGPEGDDKDQKHPWVDDSGKPLVEGAQYEMHSTGYAIPDKIKVLAVTPNKLSYELEAGDIAYKDTITTDDVYKQGYTFQPAKPGDDPGMQIQQPPKRQPLELEHPKPPRPGDDAAPQQDDLSTPPTRVSHEHDPEMRDYMMYGIEGEPDLPGGNDEETGEVCPYCMRRDPSVAEFGQCIHCKKNNDMEDEGNAYLGSFRGDAPDSRSWLNDPGPGQGVEVDPNMMAKVAGKDFSAREQRQFIDETGTARNLHRLNLEGTHYELDDYGDSLW